MKNFLSIRVQKHLNVLKNLNNQIYQIFEELSTSINDTLNKGNKVISFGNGGSAADSIHFTGELLFKYKSNLKLLPAIRLNSNVSVLTSIGNDFGYLNVKVDDILINYKNSHQIIENEYNRVKSLNSLRLFKHIKNIYE